MNTRDPQRVPPASSQPENQLPISNEIFDVMELIDQVRADAHLCSLYRLADSWHVFFDRDRCCPVEGCERAAGRDWFVVRDGAIRCWSCDMRYTDTLFSIAIDFARHEAHP